MNQAKHFLILVFAAVAAISAHAQALSPRDADGPAVSLSMILGRPTDQSITLSILSATAIEARVAYGVVPGPLPEKSEPRTLKAGVPLEFDLVGLKSDTPYAYQVLTRRPGDGEFQPQPPAGFHTQRATGSAFCFDIQGDSHPERPNENDPALYVRTLQGAASDRPDFFIAMGDDFSVDTLRTITPEAVAQRYLLQRPFLSRVAQSAPLFLVNGNHEQAAGCNLNGTPSNVAVWAQTSRNALYPQPGPGGFYTGDSTPAPFIGLLRDYYAWTWGDALFVVIDPYWHSNRPVDNVFGGGPKARDMWAITLGDEQYRWLKKTLETSRAKYKFVFAHHVLGTGRGGVEMADLFEWGGRNRRGDWAFTAERPGWALPIHPLMATNGVTIFFQGHDHVFARQQLDGVVYQTVPEPADPNYAFAKWASSFTSGDILPSSGRLRVTVAPAEVGVDYVRSWLPEDEKGGHTNGEVAFHYAIPAKKEVPAPPLSLILGRPTPTSVTLSVLSAGGGEGFVRYGPATGDCTNVTAVIPFRVGEAKNVAITPLKADSSYRYQFWLRSPAATAFTCQGDGTFRTPRRAGSPFTFTVTADSHLDENTDPAMYAQTLRNALSDHPDFHIDLGDTFMTGKRRDRPQDAWPQYLAQHACFGLLGRSVPLYLVLGNHDGESGGWMDAATRMRTASFPNPVPDGFYTGSTNGNYYAWQWGDALFVVLDPYRYSDPPGRGAEADDWQTTLGQPQYDWFQKTLESSPARYKFIFIHQLGGGGGDRQGRGGAEVVPASVHALLVKNHVTAVFHGHDHFFAKQERDGILYQLVPQPGCPGTGSFRQAASYGYTSGDLRPGSGYLRVSVGDDVAVAFVQTPVPGP